MDEPVEVPQPICGVIRQPLKMLASLFGWATFGVTVRLYQQGMRKLPFSYYPMGYIFSAGFWVGIGYFFENWKENNDRLLNKRIENLHKMRSQSVDELVE